MKPVLLFIYLAGACICSSAQTYTPVAVATFTGTVTANSAVITSIPSTTGLVSGSQVACSGLPSNDFIAPGGVGSTTVTLAYAATSTPSNPVTCTQSPYYPTNTAGLDTQPQDFFLSMGYDNLLGVKASFQGMQHIYTVLVGSPVSFNANLINGSATASVGATTGMQVGFGVTGIGITSLATITSISPSNGTINFTGTLNGTTTVSSVSSTLQLIIGQPISGASIPTGDTIAGIGVGTITLSIPATSSGSAVALQATTSSITISAPATANESNEALTYSPNSTTTFSDYNLYDGFTSSLAGSSIIRVCHPSAGYVGAPAEASCSGGAAGYTGTIVSNTAAAYPAIGETYTITPAASTAFQPGDLVTIQPPLSGLGVTNLNTLGWGVDYGTVTVSQDTTSGNLPSPAVTGLPQVYGVAQLAMSGPAEISAGLDTGGGPVTGGINGPHLLMNGTTTFCATMELISGSASVSATVLRYGGGGANTTFISGSPKTILAGTNTYCWYGSGSETATSVPTASPNSIQAELTFSAAVTVDMVPAQASAGSPCRYLDGTMPPVCLTGAAGVDANGNLTPYAHTNPTPFSDSYIAFWSRGHFKEVRVNYMASGAAAGHTLYNELQPLGYRQQSLTNPLNLGSGFQGPPLGLENALELDAAIGGDRLEDALPPHWTATDYTNLMAFLGAPCTDPWGQIRCNLGHPASWITSGISINFSNNETWNNGDNGAWLGGCCAYPGAFAYGVAAAQAIKASPYYATNITFTVPAQQGTGNYQAFSAAADPAGYTDGLDVSGYSQADTSTNCTPYSAMLAEAETTTDRSLYQNDIGLNLIGPNGLITTYENSEGTGGTGSGPCTVSQAFGLYSGLAVGLIEGIRLPVLQRAFLGHFKWWGQFALTNETSSYASTAPTNPATTTDQWISVENLRGAGAHANGKYLATTLSNTAEAMGTGINVTGSGVSTFNFTAANSIPAESNVPLTDFFAYCNGNGSGCADSNRSYLLVNYDSASHTINIGGSFALSGTVTKTTYASTNATPGLNDNNLVINATPVIQDTTTTGSAATSYTLAPYSMMLLQGSVASPTGGWLILQ